MKFAVITDAHGNLPALQAALAAIAGEDCDAVGIGPYPAETLDLLLNPPRLHCQMGNHDALFAGGLPEPRPAWMGEGDLLH